MTFYSVDGSALIAPEDVGALIVLPVTERSVAMQTSTIVPTDRQQYRIPVMTADPAAEWVAEGEDVTPADPSTDEVVVTPAKVAGLTIISRELAEDSDPAAAAIIGSAIARDIARKVDLAFFGDEAPPAPVGLPGFITETPISAGAEWTNLDPFAEAINIAAVEGVDLTGFVAHPDDALSLVTLKDEEGSARPLLGPDPSTPTSRSILGVPLYTSNAVEQGTVWGIPRARVMIVMRNDTRIEVSRDRYFESDRIAVKATMRIGFAFPHAAAVQRITLGTAS